MNTFDFTTDYILENENILLRPLCTDDYELLHEYALNEPELWKYSIAGADGSENLKTYIKTTLTERDNKKEYPFIVYDKIRQKHIGSTRFYDIQLNNQALQLGYTWYCKAAQGTTINKQCKYLLLQFAFEKMNILRVEFRANSKNERSINAMKSIGCTVEGVLRSVGPDKNGGRRDSIVLSILQHEWQETVKKNLENKISHLTIPASGIQINLTSSEATLKECAKMMSETAPWTTLHFDYDSCLASFKGNDKEVYIITESSELLGFVILQMAGSFRGYVQSICISAAHRNKGLGKKLLTFCEERIFKVSPNVFIRVSSFNKQAQKFYADLGYKTVGEMENFMVKGYAEILLRKTIGPTSEFIPSD